MEQEVWKDIKGYEGFYQVSNMGRVKALEREVLYSNGRRHKYGERFLSTFTNHKGYVTVCLCKNGVCTAKRLHQVVIGAFYERPYGLNSINHKDENKQNNRLDNLEYCTSKYNSNYGTRAERYKEKVTNDPRRSKRVIQTNLDGDFIREFPSLREIEREFGYEPVHIRDVCNGKQKTSYGFKWKWACNRIKEETSQLTLF